MSKKSKKPKTPPHTRVVNLTPEQRMQRAKAIIGQHLQQIEKVVFPSGVMNLNFIAVHKVDQSNFTIIGNSTVSDLAMLLLGIVSSQQPKSVVADESTPVQQPVVDSALRGEGVSAPVQPGALSSETITEAP